MVSIMGRPWDVYLAQNQVANRVALDTVNSGVKMAIARNKDERWERFFSWFGYLTLALALPAVLDYGLSRQFARMWRTAAKGNPVKLPYQLIEHHAVQDILNNPTVATLKKYDPHITLQEWQTVYGLKRIEDLTPKLVKNIRWAKPLMMFVDFALAASKGIIVYGFRNWFTEKNSKKKGFVGEFNYTNNAYREKKNEHYQKTKKQRKALALGIGYGCATALPLLVWQTLRSKSAKGVVASLKQHLPKINYTDAIFMSRWLIFYQSLFAYDVQKLLAARDSHELREDIIELAIYNATYFGADAVISGAVARRLQKKIPAAQLQGIALTKPVKAFGKTIQAAVPFQDMYRILKNNAHPAYKASRKIFFIGFAGSAVAMSLFTLLNFQYTKYKALKQQGVFNRKLIDPLLKVISRRENLY